MTVDDPRLLAGEPAGIYYPGYSGAPDDPLTPLLRTRADECRNRGDHEAMPINTRTLGPVILCAHCRSWWPAGIGRHDSWREPRSSSDAFS